MNPEKSIPNQKKEQGLQFCYDKGPCDLCIFTLYHCCYSKATHGHSIADYGNGKN
jgi:hypothetical protein